MYNSVANQDSRFSFKGIPTGRVRLSMVKRGFRPHHCLQRPRRQQYEPLKLVTGRELLAGEVLEANFKLIMRSELKTGGHAVIAQAGLLICRSILTGQHFTRSRH